MALRSGSPACCGTQDDSVIWFNTTDCTGLAFSTFVLVSAFFAASVIAVIYAEGTMNTPSCVLIYILLFMAIWSHLRTMMGDPGAVPPNAHPLLENIETSQIVCGRCECYKPPMSHHGQFPFILVI